MCEPAVHRLPPEVCLETLIDFPFLPTILSRIAELDEEDPIFQLLLKIFLHLRPKDRLSIALVCRRWFEETSTPQCSRIFD